MLINPTDKSVSIGSRQATYNYWSELKLTTTDGPHTYGEWRRGVTATMRQTHAAGEKLFVDLAGDIVPLFDAITGEARDTKMCKPRSIGTPGCNRRNPHPSARAFIFHVPNSNNQAPTVKTFPRVSGNRTAVIKRMP